MMHKKTTTPPRTDAERLARRRAALMLAALCSCDVRTAIRFLEHGPEAIRSIALREALRRQVAQIRAGEPAPA